MESEIANLEKPQNQYRIIEIDLDRNLKEEEKRVIKEVEAIFPKTDFFLSLMVISLFFSWIPLTWAISKIY